MRRTLFALAGATALMGIATAAGAQAWTNIETRAKQLDSRIYSGIRSGQITETEAAQLRTGMRDVVRLEQRYSRNGLDARERADLDRRWDAVSNRIYAQRHDNDRNNRSARWENLNRRQAAFNQRLNQAVRDRRVTQRQADDLRAEFNRIAALETRYRRKGLNATERADLDNRMDQLQARFRSQVSANEYGYGYGQAPNLFDYLFGIR